MTRLSLKTLSGLPGDVARPRYDVLGVRVGIVHLGVGAFHRAHQAIHVDDRLAGGRDGMGDLRREPALGRRRARRWRRRTGSTRSPFAAPRARRCASSAPCVGSSSRPRSPRPLLAAMSDPGGQDRHADGDGEGLLPRPRLAPARRGSSRHPPRSRHPGAPRSAPGFLVEALARRRAAGVAPFTVVSCDNLPSNGETARNVVARLAELRDADLGRWMTGEVAFPSTMVDRIVPATTDEDRARIAGRLGVEDAWPVVTEPFSQWVIEDRFPAGRPRFEDSGATLVADVAPFELAKLRLLNGSHSTLAYLGYLAGYETVAEAMADDNLARLVAELMTMEVAPTLDARATGDLGPYMRELQARFRNPALRHRTWQIAMDGSQKLPQRLLGERRGRGSRRACRSIASPSASPPGCATSPASTSRAARSTCAIRSPPG